MLLVVGVLVGISTSATLLRELGVADLAVTGYGPIRAHALLGEANNANAIVHLAAEHVLVGGRCQA